VVPRQRPPTAKGFVSITMQDKDGPNSVTVKPDTYGRYYKVLRSFFSLVVEAPWRASRLQGAGRFHLRGIHDRGMTSSARTYRSGYSMGFPHRNSYE